MIHVIRGASDASIIQTALENELEEIVDTRKNIVHEHDGIKVLVLCVSQLMERHKGSVSNLGEILDPVVERAACALRCAYGDSETNRASECVKNAEERLGLVRRAILVNGYVNVVVTQDGGNAKEGSKDVWNDVEGVVKVNGEEVLVLSARVITPMSIV